MRNGRASVPSCSSFTCLRSHQGTVISDGFVYSSSYDVSSSSSCTRTRHRPSMISIGPLDLLFSADVHRLPCRRYLMKLHSLQLEEPLSAHLRSESQARQTVSVPSGPVSFLSLHIASRAAVDILLTLHVPPVACFIAHFLHRLGCLQPGAWYAIGLVEQLRHAASSDVSFVSATSGRTLVEVRAEFVVEGSEKPRVIVGAGGTWSRR